MNVVFWNGRFSPADEIRIDPADGGFLHGAGLFETMRAENGRVFRLERHLVRLQNSCEMLLRPITRNRLPSARQFSELLEANELSSARIRLTVTSGPMSPTVSDDPPFSILATAAALAPYPEELYVRGVSVAIGPYRQNLSDPLAGHKSTAYFPRLLGLREAQKSKCVEALWFNENNELGEGCISNVFLVHGETLSTPSVSTPILPGITREAVLELAANAGISAGERPLHIDDLLDADECFLTNTMMGVMPVIRVEKKDIGSGKPGDVARRLRMAYQGLVRLESGSA